MRVFRLKKVRTSGVRVKNGELCERQRRTSTANPDKALNHPHSMLIVFFACGLLPTYCKRSQRRLEAVLRQGSLCCPVYYNVILLFFVFYSSLPLSSLKAVSYAVRSLSFRF